MRWSRSLLKRLGNMDHRFPLLFNNINIGRFVKQGVEDAVIDVFDLLCRAVDLLGRGFWA